MEFSALWYDKKKEMGPHYHLFKEIVPDLSAFRVTHCIQLYADKQPVHFL